MAAPVSRVLEVHWFSNFIRKKHYDIGLALVVETMVRTRTLANDWHPVGMQALELLR